MTNVHSAIGVGGPIMEDKPGFVGRFAKRIPYYLRPVNRFPCIQIVCTSLSVLL
jgi:hypothetical protein